MGSKRSLLLVTLLATSLVAAPAVANIFTVTLHNGGTFESRYQPRQAAWDATMVEVLVGTGNWVALPASEVASVTSTAESRGFGKVIDTTTIDLGLAPLEFQEEVRQARNEVFQSLPDALTRSYDIQQFSEPSVAGQGGPTGGIPVFGTGFGGGGQATVPGSFDFQTGTGIPAPGPTAPPAPQPPPN